MGRHVNSVSLNRSIKAAYKLSIYTLGSCILPFCVSFKATHVQYTQTDTIRQTDGPLVPMVGLVPIEKDVIPMVLLVDMHLIKGTLIIL